MKPRRAPDGWVAPGPRPAGGVEAAADEEWSYLCGDWRILQKRRGHRWSLDDLMTAWVATRDLDPARAWRAIDLGCGLGSVLLCVAWRLPHARVDGIEAQPERAAMARRSLAYDGCADRCTVRDGDLRALDAGGYELVTGTPPYFPRGTGTEPAADNAHALACRFEVRGGVEDYLATAVRIAAPGARIVVCTAALERARVAAAAAALPLAWREHWAVVPKVGKPALVDVDVFAAGSPAGPRTDHRLVVRDADDQWTAEFVAVREAMGFPPRRAA